MSYFVQQFRGFYYIRGNSGDPAPPRIGPFRFETEAQLVANELNEKLVMAQIKSRQVQ